jgi:hypothetical protein
MRTISYFLSERQHRVDVMDANWPN